MAGFSPWMAAAGGLGAGALFNNPDFNNPANAAFPYLNQIPDELKKYFDPYIQQGRGVDPSLQEQYQGMTNDPSGFLSKLGQGYQQSPGYQFKLNQALNAGNNAAAAGGMLGSPAHQQQNEQVANGIASQDYNDWMDHVLGIFGGGQKGLQGISDRGFGASSNYAEDLAQALMGQASLAGQGAAEENRFNQANEKNKYDLFGQFLGAGAQFI